MCNFNMLINKYGFLNIKPYMKKVYATLCIAYFFFTVAKCWWLLCMFEYLFVIHIFLFVLQIVFENDDDHFDNLLVFEKGYICLHVRVVAL